MYIYLLCTIPFLCVKVKHVWLQSRQVSWLGYSFVSEWRHTCFKTGISCIDTRQWRLSTGFRGYGRLWLVYEIDIWAANVKLTVHFIEVLRKYFWQCQVTKVFWKYDSDYVTLEASYAADNWCLLSKQASFEQMITSMRPAMRLPPGVVPDKKNYIYFFPLNSIALTNRRSCVSRNS
jgi:hypothetical protein